MDNIPSYTVVLLALLALEECYFRLASRLGIVDRPNERSSHTSPVLRGGGVVIALSALVWGAWLCARGEWESAAGALPFLCGLALVAGVSMADDVRSLPDSARLAAQFAATALMLRGAGLLTAHLWWAAVPALVVSVGATNIYNFMDGVNGMTGCYTLAALVPLALLNARGAAAGFTDQRLLVCAALGTGVFCLFNLRPKGKARCFAGDVGSISAAFIVLHAVWSLVARTGDASYLALLLVYGVDGCLTICHRVMLRENLGKAHRKHAFQIMANELGVGHVKVALLYAGAQLAISLGLTLLCPDGALCHWLYTAAAGAVLSLAYVAFMRKYYHLHRDYLASLEAARRAKPAEGDA